MDLVLKPFRRADYPEYASWFGDPELDRHLGPMDEEWLDAVLSQPESAGATWAVFHGQELVAVVETVFAPQNALPAAVAAIAVKPARRRQGIGLAALCLVLALHKAQGIAEHIAYISPNNPIGRRLVEKAGFAPAAAVPHAQGYILFRHRQ